MVQRYRFLAAGGLVAVVFLTAVAVLPGIVRAGAWIILSEDFESGIAAWTVSDENPASGLDYWGGSSARAHTGSGSAWCAQIGTSSVNGLPNPQNGYYDQDMDANLIAVLGDISGFSSVGLSFWYWAVTGTFSLADFLSIWYFAGGSWTQIWSQSSVSSNGWQQVSVTIPSSATAIAFLFHSDPTVGFGPYEGVYVDDIVVTGIDSVAPQSAASPLPAFTATRDFAVPFSASDNPGGSGLLSVTLYYRVDGGAWTSYPGTFPTSPIPFSATSDGAYAFYTVAMDRSGNVEPAPASADASTLVDTVPPTLTIHQPTASQWVGSTTVGVAWSAADAGSGIEGYTLALDGGSAVDVGVSLSYTFNGVAEGSHTATVTAADRAGNRVQASVGFGVDVTEPVLTIVSPNAGRDVVERTVVIFWSGSDSGSGIDHYEIRLDDGSFVRVESGTTYTFEGVADGAHTVTVKAVDAAGNTREEALTFRVNTNWLTGGGPLGWFPVIALILVIFAILLGIVLWRRRSRQQARPPD